jgi:hypothetical protein
MASQYAHLDGRRYVNAEFVGKVREAFPATTKKIPLGYSTYTGWGGKDEVLFTEHAPLDEDAGLEGQVYEVTFDPSHPECFEEDILGKVGHTKVEKKASLGAPRRRLTADAAKMGALWGPTLEDAVKRRTARERKSQAVRRVRELLAKEQAPREWISWDPSDG